jgi:hypothetical protein
MAIVYQHRRGDDGSVFYVGVGKDYNRAYSKAGRNKYWHNIVNKVGYFVDILHHECSIEEAKRIEVGLIETIGRHLKGTGKLVNITDGGDHTDTNGGKIVIHKGDNERFIYKNMLLDYEADGWSVGRSDKSKRAVGIANAKSQLGKKHSEITLERMRGPRKSYKIDSEIASKIIKLYETREVTIEEISHIVNLSFPTILKFLKERKLYTKTRAIKECPHCKVKGGGSNMKRYHFDNCKLKKAE